MLALLATQRARLAQATQALRLPGGFRWYSIRRGGATAANLSGVPLGVLMLRGRWSDPRTARIYISDGLAMLADLSVPPAHRALLLARARHVRPGFRVD